MYVCMYVRNMIWFNIYIICKVYMIFLFCIINICHIKKYIICFYQIFIVYYIV